jgi:hypothetical protein
MPQTCPTRPEPNNLLVLKGAEQASRSAWRDEGWFPLPAGRRRHD